MGGLTSGLAFGLAGGVEGALATGLAAGLVIGLILWRLAALVVGLTVGLVIGLKAGLTVGSWSVSRTAWRSGSQLDLRPVSRPVLCSGRRTGSCTPGRGQLALHLFSSPCAGGLRFASCVSLKMPATGMSCAQ
jgi:hypothetical protein